MKSFTYKIKDALGIHARPAGMLVKAAKNYESEITIENNGKSAKATKLMAIMGLAVKCGDTVNVTVNGSDEDNAVEAMEKFFNSSL